MLHLLLLRPSAASPPRLPSAAITPFLRRGMRLMSFEDEKNE